MKKTTILSGSIALTLASIGVAGCAAASDETPSTAPSVGQSTSALSVSPSGPSDPFGVGTSVSAGETGKGATIGFRPPPFPRPPHPTPSPLQAIRNHAKQFVHAKPLTASPSSWEVPYRYGLSYGLGIDSPSGTAMNLVATGTPTTIPGAGGQNMTFTWTEISSQEDLMSHLGISADASGSIGLFSASARFNFSKDVHVNSSSVFAVIDLQVMNAFSQIDAPGVAPNASSLVSSGNMTAFQQQFGDRFVRGILTGGAFFGTVEIETSSEQDKQDIESTISGAFSVVGSASVSLSDSFSKAIQNHSVHVQVYTEGGTPPTPLPTDPVSLMNAANKWLPSVQNNGTPYMVLVDGDSVLPLPNPPTYIDLQQQEDVLTQCSLDRNADLETLNDITYVKTHPSQFVNMSGNPLGSADFAALDSLASKISQDMTAITQAADNALSNPKNAALPVLQVQPPAVLPVQRIASDPLIAVPNLLGMYPPDADSLLKGIGLGLSGGGYVVNYSCSDGDIFYQTPPAGVMVPKGSGVNVTICRNPNEE